MLVTESRDGSDLVAFLASLSDGQAAIVREVHRTIAEVAPELLPPAHHGPLFGYGPFHYRYVSGREGDAYLISVRGGSKQLSIYVSAIEDGRYVPEMHARNLGITSVGRSCIRVKRPGDLDLPAFAEVVRHAVELGGEGSSSGGTTRPGRC